MTQTSTLTMVIHAESGIGKSQLADTVPAPRLILDAEGGSEFTPSWPKVIWNPNVYAPPGIQGCEPGQEQVTETTRVLVNDWQTLTRVFMWLESGQHHFVSGVFDSLTEIQKRCKDALGTETGMTQQLWGELLAQMELAVRRMRDLTLDPNNSLKNIIVLALTDEKKGARRPYIQGALSTTLPGFFHVVAYMYTEPRADGSGFHDRRILIQPWTIPLVGLVIAKDRTHVLTRVFGPVIPIKDIDTGLSGYDLQDLVHILDNRQQYMTPGGVA